MTLSLRRFSATAAALLTLGILAPAMAQEPASAQENIELFVGDIFEITPSHSLQNPTYTWILTQDRTFIEAGRAPTFRKRLITPGVYTLYAEVSGDNQNLSRTFTLDYRARVPGQQPVVGSGSAGALVRTSPPADERGRVVLAEGSQLLKLDPTNPDLRPVIADLDLNRDSDGDGDPANDIDTEQTFFQTDATPLHVWLAQPFTTRPMSVTIARPDGAQQQILEIYDAAYAREQGIARASTDVTIEQIDDRTYRFGATFPAGISPQTPLLYHWDFGDGQQSLLANPEHEYASDGTYEVRLRIRDLTTGREIAMYSEDLTVDAGPNAQPPEEEPTEEPATNGGSGIGIGSILLLAGVFIASLLFGIGVIVLLSKLRGRGKSFSDTIEKMEQTIVKKDDKSGAPPPLTIAPPAPSAKQTPPPEIAQREKENASTNPARQQTPTVNEQNAPSWLKSGLAGQTVPAPNAPQTQQPPRQQTPPPAQQAPKPQTPPPAPQAAPATPPAQPARFKDAPNWLQEPVTPRPTQQQTQKPASPQAPVQTPSAAPAQPRPVQTPPAPAPQPTAPVAPPAPPVQTPPPAPVAPPAAPVQTPPAAPAQAPAPQQAPAAPTPPATNPADQPVAFIRADSLDAPKQENGQNPPPQAA